MTLVVVSVMVILSRLSMVVLAPDRLIPPFAPLLIVLALMSELLFGPAELSELLFELELLIPINVVRVPPNVVAVLLMLPREVPLLVQIPLVEVNVVVNVPYEVVAQLDLCSRPVDVSVPDRLAPLIAIALLVIPIAMEMAPEVSLLEESTLNIGTLLVV